MSQQGTVLHDGEKLYPRESPNSKVINGNAVITGGGRDFNPAKGGKAKRTTPFTERG